MAVYDYQNTYIIKKKKKIKLHTPPKRFYTLFERNIWCRDTDFAYDVSLQIVEESHHLFISKYNIYYINNITCIFVL